MTDPMKVIASTVRGALIAPAGKKLLSMDFAGIESRVTACIAGEDWEIEAFRRQDHEGGPDNYEIAYAEVFGVDPMDVEPDQRQKGKPIALSMGFEGGVGALVTMSKNYKVPLESLAAAVTPTLTEDEVKSAIWVFEKTGGHGLNRGLFIPLDAIKQRWRRKHPATKQLWRDLKDAAILACQNPGKVYQIPNGKIKFATKDRWLYMRLPSGRRLAYFQPEVHYDDMWCPGCLHHFDISADNKRRTIKKEFKKEEPVCEVCSSGADDMGPSVNMHTVKDPSTARVTYMGIDTKKRIWSRVSAYGGKWCENAVQATARDLMVNAMHNVERRGLEIIMTVHDEIVLEIPDGAVTLEEVESEMCRLPEWAAGWPIAAEGWIDQRYKKD
jgi:DNA polymerase bacteriophage-type